VSEFEVFLSRRNEIASFRIVRDDGRETELRLYSLDASFTQREVTRWCRERGCVPAGCWVGDGKAMRRRFTGEPFSHLDLKLVDL
jgi:hypothetical protein